MVEKSWENFFPGWLKKLMQFWKSRLPTKIIKVENRIISGQKVWALYPEFNHLGIFENVMVPDHFRHLQKVERKNSLCPNSLGTLKNPDA
jgi:hypothetical protein